MSAGFVYDTTTDTALLFGGVQVLTVEKEDQWSSLQDTWLWDGKNWAEMRPDNTPPPRRNPQLVYLPWRKEVLMFGGIQDGKTGSLPHFLHDTWSWNGENWIEHPVGELDNGAIPQPSMACDVEHQTVVLWQYITGTWIWDNTHWINLHPTDSPDLYIEGVLGYDETRRQVVFWGLNRKNGRSIPETWLWDGISWTPVDTGSDRGPTDTLSSAKVMIYDTQRQSLLLIVLTGDKFKRNHSIWLWTGISWQLL